MKEKINKIKTPQFWGKKKEKLDSLNLESEQNMPQQQKLGKFKKLKIKKPKFFSNGLGITGGIVLVILAIVSLIGYKLLVQPALTLYVSANTIKKDMNEITQSIANRDLIELEAALQETEKHLEELRTDRESKFGWMKDTTVFKANEFYEDSDRFINAGHLAIEAIREIMGIVTPFADAAGLRVLKEQEVVQAEGLMEAFQAWVSLMPQVAEEMDIVLETLTLLGEELEPVNTAKYPKEMRNIPIRSNVEFAKNSLVKAKDYAPDIKQALVILPRMLGVDSYIAKRYMVIMQNNMEIRPTGGFWTNYATFKMRDALLQSDFTSKDFYSIDNTLDIIDATYDFPDAPPAYTKYLQIERWYARDTNSSPDLATSVDQFMFYYNMGNRINPLEIKPIEGIITIDTQVIKELMEITGPVTVNGVTYNSENVVLELERLASLNIREQINRKGVLGDLMEAMLVNVFESERYLWSQLIDKVVDLAMRKHIQGFSFDEEAQVLLEKYGFAGKLATPEKGDYSMVVSTNLGGDKTNWFTNKIVNHTLEKEGDRWVRTVEIVYNYEQPGDEYAPFIKRFKDWVRVYVPAGSELISFEGSEDATDVGTGTGEEGDKMYYYGYVELGPDETKTLTVKYYLPEGVVGEDVYDLLIQKQAGIVSEMHNVKAGNEAEEVELMKDEKVSIRF
ncbi:DUF4012 domain-containing protein [Patescibacteria group bacterium]